MAKFGYGNWKTGAKFGARAASGAVITKAIQRHRERERAKEEREKDYEDEDEEAGDAEGVGEVTEEKGKVKKEFPLDSTTPAIKNIQPPKELIEFDQIVLSTIFSGTHLSFSTESEQNAASIEFRKAIETGKTVPPLELTFDAKTKELIGLTDKSVGIVETAKEMEIDKIPVIVSCTAKSGFLGLKRELVPVEKCQLGRLIQDTKSYLSEVAKQEEASRKRGFL